MSEHNIIKLSANPDGFGVTPDELSQDMFASAIPVQHTHTYFEDKDLGLYIGLWDTTEMVEVSAPYACEEFMVLLEGTAKIQNAKLKHTQTVEAGESFVIPREYNCQWHQTGYLKKFYVIYENPIDKPNEPIIETIVKVNDRSPIGDNVCYLNTSEQFTYGTHHSNETQTSPATSDKHQFIYQRKGSMRIFQHNNDVLQQDEISHEISLNSGEAIFIPAGTRFSWQCDETILQDYVEIQT